jgi:hypothetical protein
MQDEPPATDAVRINSRSMAEPRQVTAVDADGWKAINDLAVDFADGVVREAAVVAGEHVDVDGVMRFGGYPRLVVHTQMQGGGGVSIRLEFAGVRHYAFNYDVEVSPAIARDVGAGVWEVRFLSLRVTAEDCAALVVGSDGLGEGPFLVRV